MNPTQAPPEGATDVRPFHVWVPEEGRSVTKGGGS
jgi:hypothetical protein